MREIKFRAWKYPKEFVNNQKLEGEMLYVEMKSEKNYMASSHTGWMFYVYKEDMSDVMQFTGLKDKNGKEIYEGDIVTRTDFPDGKYSVKYFEDDGAFGFWENSAIGAKERFWFAMHSKKYEVIGNIYENPELLTPVKGKE